jgi:ethanolamine ammonia-lyase small subunit
MKFPFLPDFWDHLRQYTSARIALGRAGGSIPTKSLLEFRLAHASARDAVNNELNISLLQDKLHSLSIPIIPLQSFVENKQSYLLSPHLGRRLNKASKELLTEQTHAFDICLVAADGLSSTAIELHLTPLLEKLLPLLKDFDFNISPMCLVKYGRVAIGDDIADSLKSQLVIVFIGERPGLTTPNSLGIYLTYSPALGITDERRNCISNIHEGGLDYETAADKLIYLIKEAFIRKISGVELKDERLML